MTYRYPSLFSFPLTLALLVPLSLTTLACGGDDDDDGGDACDESTLTYANFGESFFSDYCTVCHSPTAATRQAPDLDTFANVSANAARVNARAGTGITMPPLDPRPGAADRDLLAEWISCGAPE
jgi:uncharacterized membrane protein